MSPNPGVPDIATFVAASRQQHGPCKFVRLTTPMQREAITEQVDLGNRTWAAYVKWLKVQDVVTEGHIVQYHYDHGHGRDR